LFGHVVHHHQGLKRRSVRLDAWGPAVAAEKRVEFLDIGRQPWRNVAERAGVPHFLARAILGGAEGLVN